MNASQNTGGPDAKEPLADTAGSKDSKEPPAEKIVIPDECGDSLWDDVLAQYPDLTMVIKKQSDTAKNNPGL